MDYIGFIYLWENIVNQKKYIGLHVGKVDDGYIGSGTYFQNAIKKHGIENFKRQILHFETISVQALYQKEYEIINEFNAVKSPEYYNQTNISPNAFKWVTGKMVRAEFTEEHRNNIRKGRLGIKDSIETKQKKKTKSGTRGKRFYNDGDKEYKFIPGSEPKNLIEGRLQRMVPSPGTGLVWCNNSIIDKRFNPTEIPVGWHKGRLYGINRNLRDEKGRFK